MQTIVEACERHAKKIPDQPFCYFHKKQEVTLLTYGQLYEDACRFANLFESHGLKKGDVILIILDHTPDMYAAFIGAMLADYIPSFMPYPTEKQDSQLYWQSHRELFTHIQAGLLLTYHEYAEEVREKLSDLGMAIDIAQSAQSFDPVFEVKQMAPDAIAFLQHSSGTTGLKKGVALSHQAVLLQVKRYSQALQLTDQDRIVSWLPLYHDMGLIACFMLPLITATTIVQLDPFEWVVQPVRLFEAVTQYQATLCWMPNFAFHHLCRTVRPQPELDLRSMRAWINCSEPCKIESFNRFEERFRSLGVCYEQLQVCYAMAETVFAVTQTAVGEKVATIEVDRDAMLHAHQVKPVQAGHPSLSYVSTGKTITSLHMMIVDEQGQQVEPSEVGEIIISGSSLFSGYFKQDAITSKKLRHHWYYTGDLGFLQKGELFITGRKDDMIIVHGRNYYAHQLEYIVNHVSGVKPGRSVAVGYYLAAIGSEEVVVIAESDCSDSDREQLASDIKHHLVDAGGLLPHDVLVVEPGWLVKTTSGKMSRHANLKKYCLETKGTLVSR